MQDVFVDLWARKEGGTLPALSRAYLFTAVRNRALKHLRHRRVVLRWAREKRREDVPQGRSADHDVRSREVAVAIDRAIDRLPRRCREVFLLSRHEELTYAEIATVLDISVKTVETQMWRALKALRTELAPFLT